MMRNTSPSTHCGGAALRERTRVRFRAGLPWALQRVVASMPLLRFCDDVTVSPAMMTVTVCQSGHPVPRLEPTTTPSGVRLQTPRGARAGGALSAFRSKALAANLM